MARRRSLLNRTILLLALLAAIVMGYYLPTKRPESGMTLAPKDHLELIERKKAQREHFGGSAETDTTDHSAPLSPDTP